MCIVNQKDINRLINLDKIFDIIKKKYGNPPDWTRPQGFISLSKIIVEQQVSLASANAHFLKLSNYLNEFTPSNIPGSYYIDLHYFLLKYNCFIVINKYPVFKNQLHCFSKSRCFIFPAGSYKIRKNIRMIY